MKKNFSAAAWVFLQHLQLYLHAFADEDERTTTSDGKTYRFLHIYTFLWRKIRTERWRCPRLRQLLPPRMKRDGRTYRRFLYYTFLWRRKRTGRWRCLSPLRPRSRVCLRRGRGRRGRRGHRGHLDRCCFCCGRCEDRELCLNLGDLASRSRCPRLTGLLIRTTRRPNL